MSKIGLIVLILILIFAGIGGYFIWQGQRIEKRHPQRVPPGVEIFEEKPQKKKKFLSPKEVFKIWFEGQIKGDWNAVFANMVDVDGKPYSEECEEGFKKAFDDRLGAEYTLDVKEEEIKIQNCKESPELKRLAEIFGVQLPEGECAIVPFSYWLKHSDGSEEGLESELSFLKVNEEWKVLMWCAPLIKQK
jgi:hypothetical protein